MRVFLFIVAAMLAIAEFVAAQQQPSVPRSAWPCTGRLDPSYFRVAEGSGGHLLLLAPDEIADSASLLLAFTSHQQTIFRLAGSVTPGLHDFQVPIDPSVESVVFSVSVQCLDAVYVLDPSGALASGDAVTNRSTFRAERMVIVRQPQPGMWTVRVAGSGVAGITVQAKSPLGIAGVEFSAAGSTTFMPVPAFGVENTVRLRMGRIAQPRASQVSGVDESLGSLPLSLGETEGTYLSRFLPDAGGFRVMVVGRDEEGFAVQRMYAPLFAPLR